MKLQSANCFSVIGLNNSVLMQAISRRAGELYVIYLPDNRFILTEGILRNHVEITVLQKRSWQFPELKLIGYSKGKLLLLNSYKEESFKLFILTGENNIKISCSCNMEVKKLCTHAFWAINIILQNRTAEDLMVECVV
jgi:hypothetical protein